MKGGKGMKRSIEKRLVDWYHDPNKKPLIIKGARQVGKTTTIRKFARQNYANLIEINFEQDLKYISLFQRTHNPKEILEYLKIEYIDVAFNKKTILFMDEIQACPDAITTLKFMKESFPCDIICSGSMLGVAVAKTTSYPVGYVETWDMYPMSFLEFLSAYGVDQTILNKINQSLDQLNAIPELLHEKMNELFTTYIIVGGMPEVVKTFIDTKSIKETLLVQRRIVNDYFNDMANYAIASDKIKARECFTSIPVQLAKENKKFQYSVIKKGYNARYYDSSLQWLEDSGVILKVNRIAHIDMPLEKEVELSVFKVYMADTGLFISQLNDGDIQKIISGELGIYKGALYENIAAQIFKRMNKKCYYYEPSQSSEIDFIIYYNGTITPIEVKAGKHTTSKAFRNYVNRYRPTYAFRFSQKNIGISSEDAIQYLPLYLLDIIVEHEQGIDFDNTILTTFQDI